MGQEGVPKTLSLSRALHQTRNVHYIQERWHFAETVILNFIK